MGKVGAWEVLEGRRQFLAKKRSPLEKIEGESWRESILASDFFRRRRGDLICASSSQSFQRGYVATEREYFVANMIIIFCVAINQISSDEQWILVTVDRHANVCCEITTSYEAIIFKRLMLTSYLRNIHFYLKCFSD